ncbi:MAG: TetR family transcriptional regulator [Betaproteobacteria bacterium RBG_16_66_20]|nr:MAG: TetR family transcriptional regulator [Betaproteobacteria bacterium RBG_16_66_20]
MKKPRNKVQTGGNRRQELLGVCARLFREKGFDGATIRDISAAAGMHSGSPFYHFPNKQEMLLAVMEEGLAQGLRRSEAVLAERLPPAEKFRRLVRSHLGTILEEGNDFIPVLLYDWRSLTPANRRRVIALKDRYDSLWQRMLDELARAGLIAGDPQMARLFVLGAVNWAAQWYRPRGRMSLDEIAAQAARLLLK